MNVLNIISLIFFALLLSIAEAAVSKRFIFRFDDVEDFFHSDKQIEVMDYFMDNNIGVSVGIIGDYVNGDDPALYTSLLRCVSLGADRCALFNHGSNAQFIFGDSTSVAQAKEQIQKCDTKIKTLFPGYRTQMFTPHQNSWNNYVWKAVQELGYDAISASDLVYSGMTWNMTSRPLKMPQQATTAGFVNGPHGPSDGTWVGIPVSQTVADCNAAVAIGEVCVIMSHAHEFSLGSYTMDNLKVGFFFVVSSFLPLTLPFSTCYLSFSLSRCVVLFLLSTFRT
jgi:hypothetical protein